MSRIRGKDTKPEIQVRSLLHQLGYRFRLNSQLPGKPDVVLPKYKAAIFVHGCFWHRHEDCPQCYTPKSRPQFWLKKFEANMRRDQKVKGLIQEEGWQHIVIWECEIRSLEILKRRIRKLLYKHKP